MIENGRHRRFALVGRVLVAGLVLVTLGVTAYGWHVQRAVANGLGRLPGDVFAGLTVRPAAAAAGGDKPAVTVLLLGSDRREGRDAGGGVTGERADSILIARLADGHQRMTVLSIPRDAWVDIAGHGTGKITTTLQLGGPTLTVGTVENLTGLRMDHVVVADFEAVRQLTTALGGVTVDDPAASTDPLTRTHFDAGPISLAGDRALTFVRQEYALPHGDLDRIARQHLLLSSLGHDVVTKSLTDPALLQRVVDVLHSTVSADAGLTPDLFRELFTAAATAKNVAYYTAPVSGSPDGPGHLTLDRTRLTAAAEALRAGQPLPLPLSLSAGPS